VDLANLGSESETCVGSRVRLVGVFISFEKNFYRLPFTPPLSGSPYRSFKLAKQYPLDLLTRKPIWTASNKFDPLQIKSTQIKVFLASI
jgi:hypothetical protein